MKTFLFFTALFISTLAIAQQKVQGIPVYIYNEPEHYTISFTFENPIWSWKTSPNIAEQVSLILNKAEKLSKKTILNMMQLS